MANAPSFACFLIVTVSTRWPVLASVRFCDIWHSSAPALAPLAQFTTQAFTGFSGAGASALGVSCANVPVSSASNAATTNPYFENEPEALKVIIWGPFVVGQFGRSASRRD
jgi:hypothetical protein